MTIDWNKPLECEISGEEKKVVLTNLGAELCNVACDGVVWTAHKATGEPVPSWMPRVYNAKRKPKEGEWWMCRTVGDAERPLIKSESVWVSSIGNWYKVVNVEPLYPLIKDPDF